MPTPPRATALSRTQEQLATLLRTHGVRVTPQRLAFLEFLLSYEGHPSLEVLFQGLKQRFPNLSRATVYNILSRFQEAGLIREVWAPGRTRHVDSNPAPHHHFRCLGCGKVVDLPYPILTLEEVAPRVSFSSLAQIHLLVEGWCEQCQGISETPPRTHGEQQGGQGHGKETPNKTWIFP